MVSYQGFSMSIPAGAFSRPETLKVQEVADDGSFGSSAITKTYRLDGLPSEFSGTIRFWLACTGAPSAGLFLAMGREGVDPESGEPALAYEPLAASLDSNRLTANLKGGGLAGAARKALGRRGGENEYARWFLGLHEMDTLASALDHFTVLYPRYTVAMAERLADDLENALHTGAQMGLMEGSYEKFRWPLRVFVVRRQMSPCVGFCLVYDPEAVGGRSLIDIVIRCSEEALASVANTEMVRYDVFFRLANLAAMVNDPVYQTRADKATLLREAHRIWPYAGYSLWMAATFGRSVANTSPPGLAGLKLVPLQGLPVPANRTATQHGLGMAGLLKHLADTYDESALAAVHRAIPTTAHAIDAFLEKIPEPENVWWPAFMRKYLAGEMYGVEADTLLQDVTTAQRTRVFTVGSKWDTVATFTDQFADLSAKLYRINLRYLEIPQSATMTFEIGPASINLDYVTVLLFGYKDHTLHYWQSGTRIDLPGLKALTDQGYDIVAAVVNSANQSPYTGSLGIDLRVSVNAEPTYRAYISLRTAGEMTYNDGRTMITNDVRYNPLRAFLNGKLEDGLFTAQWDTLREGKRNWGTWTIQFDYSTVPPRVTSFRVQAYESSAYDVRTWDIHSGPACAVYGLRWTDGYLFRIAGQAVANHLAPVIYRLETPPTVWWYLSTTSFDADSFLEIELE